MEPIKRVSKLLNIAGKVYDAEKRLYWEIDLFSELFMFYLLSQILMELSS